MIAHLSGELIEKGSETVVIDVSGVGYEVNIPLSTFYLLPELHNKTSLKIHMCVREDSIDLYGFITIAEKSLFAMLLGVSGVGPKLARNILSGISVEDFVSCMKKNDIARLVTVPGLGKKTAERLLLELKDKAEQIGAGTADEGTEPEETSLTDDVISALTNLGYKPNLARDAVEKSLNSVDGGGDIETLLKEALQIIASK